MNTETTAGAGGAINKAYYVIGMYSLKLILSFVFILVLLKVLKTIDFEKIRREW